MNKCLVNGCFQKVEGGICDKCKVRINQNKKPKAKKNQPVKPIEKLSKRSYPEALRKAKQSFQLLRRLETSDDNGYCKCVHGEHKHYKSCDAGHLIPAYYLAVCFDKDNVWPQEKHKNRDMMNPETSGQYKDWLIAEKGEETYIRLISRMHNKVKYSTFELIVMKEDFDKQIKEIKKIKKLN